MTRGTPAFLGSIFAAFSFFQPLLCSAESDVKVQGYEGLTVWIDCARRGAVRFACTAARNSGSLPRKHSFSLDPGFPVECQQTSGKTYRTDGPRYDCGHLVPANHLDHLEKGIKQSNCMTSILPQAANMNRGPGCAPKRLLSASGTPKTFASSGVWSGVAIPMTIIPARL